MKRMRVNINSLENSDVIATSGCSSKATHIYRYDSLSEYPYNTYKFVWNNGTNKWDVSQIYVDTFNGNGMNKNQYYIWNDANSNNVVNSGEYTACNDPHDHLQAN